jgi:hypothetical protein
MISKCGSTLIITDDKPCYYTSLTFQKIIPFIIDDYFKYKNRAVVVTALNLYNDI